MLSAYDNCIVAERAMVGATAVSLETAREEVISLDT